MKKSAFVLVFLIALVFLVIPVGGRSADNTSDSGSVILTTDHKFSPTDEALAEVRRQIINSYTPKNNEPPVLLDRSLDSKKRPTKVVAFTDNSLHRKLSAHSAIVLDARTGEEIYAHNPDRPGQPASTIKVLTSLIAIDYLKNNSLVPVSSWAASMPRSKIYLKPGKSYYADDLINAVLLASANDASVALAEKIAGSESGFAKLMTQKARELGASRTICKTASGLTAKGQQTTARDLALIFKEAMSSQEFSSRVKLIRTKTSYGKTLRNHNKALWQISGAQGGKTGYTWAAKQTYVGKFTRDGEEILVAVLGSRNMWNDIAKLVDYGFSRKEQLRIAAARENDTTIAAEENTPAQPALVVLTDSKKAASL
jgi:D-alanyl-D-alanine carboxypeptidase (penicillin-binding protein 5/6)